MIRFSFISLCFCLVLLFSCGKSDKQQAAQNFDVTTQINEPSGQIDAADNHPEDSNPDDISSGPFPVDSDQVTTKTKNVSAVKSKTPTSKAPSRNRSVVIASTGGKQPSQTLAPTAKPQNAPSELGPMKVQLVSVVGDGFTETTESASGEAERRGFNVAGLGEVASKTRYITPLIEVDQEVVDCRINGFSARQDLTWGNTEQSRTAERMEPIRFYRTIPEKDLIKIEILDLYGNQQVMVFRRSFDSDGYPIWNTEG